MTDFEALQAQSRNLASRIHALSEYRDDMEAQYREWQDKRTKRLGQYENHNIRVNQHIEELRRMARQDNIPTSHAADFEPLKTPLEKMVGECEKDTERVKGFIRKINRDGFDSFAGLIPRLDNWLRYANAALSEAQDCTEGTAQVGRMTRLCDYYSSAIAYIMGETDEMPGECPSELLALIRPRLSGEGADQERERMAEPPKASESRFDQDAKCPRIAGLLYAVVSFVAGFLGICLLELVEMIIEPSEIWDSFAEVYMFLGMLTIFGYMAYVGVAGGIRILIFRNVTVKRAIRNLIILAGISVLWSLLMLPIYLAKSNTILSVVFVLLGILPWIVIAFADHIDDRFCQTTWERVGLILWCVLSAVIAIVIGGVALGESTSGFTGSMAHIVLSQIAYLVAFIRPMRLYFDDEKLFASFLMIAPVVLAIFAIVATGGAVWAIVADIVLLAIGILVAIKA